MDLLTDPHDLYDGTELGLMSFPFQKSRGKLCQDLQILFRPVSPKFASRFNTISISCDPGGGKGTSTSFVRGCVATGLKN